MPDHEEIARRLMRRFPGWRAWYGEQTGGWWAMPPARLRLVRLLSSATPEDLAAQIARADPAQRPAPKPDTDHPESPDHSWRLDQELWPVRTARRITADTLASWQAEWWRDDALTVVSELTTNAITYGAPPVTLALTLLPADDNGPCLQIDVTDGSDQEPTEKEPGENGGFGLSILVGYADISVHIHPAGKTIRATLAHPQPP